MESLKTPEEINALIRACNRAKTIIELLSSYSGLTVRDVVKAGDEACNAFGLNPWCINEGLVKGNEPVRIDTSFMTEAINEAIPKIDHLVAEADFDYFR